MKRILIAITLILSLCSLGFSADKVSPVATNTVPEISEEVLLDAYESLKNRDDITESLETLISASDELLGTLKLNGLLLGILSEEGTLKQDLIELLTFVEDKAIPLNLIDANAYYKQMLDMIKMTESPFLLEGIIKQLLDVKNLRDVTLMSKITKLIGSIVMDASKKVSEQKYQSSLHISCLKTITPKNAKKGVVEGLLSMMKKIDKQTPKMQVAIFSALSNLLRVTTKNSPLGDKTDKIKLLKYFEKFIKMSPAALGLPMALSENELVTFRKSLLPLRYLVKDENIISYSEKLIKGMKKLLKSNDLATAKNATKILLNLSNIKRTKNQYYLHKDIIELLKSKGNKVSIEKEVYLHKVLAKILVVLLKREKKKEVSEVIDITNFFYETSKTHADFNKVRTVALEGLMVFDPSYLKSRPNPAITKMFRSLIKDSIAVFNDKKFTSAYPDFVKKLSEVLYELTGKDYGTDGALWLQWNNKYGRKYFK